jgi:hypothetical protein
MAAVGGVCEIERLFVQPGLRARIGLVIAGQHLDQGGLARTVLAHQRMDLAFGYLERHIVERLRARERL